MILVSGFQPEGVLKSAILQIADLHSERSKLASFMDMPTLGGGGDFSGLGGEVDSEWVRGRVRRRRR